MRKDKHTFVSLRIETSRTKIPLEKRPSHLTLFPKVTQRYTRFYAVSQASEEVSVGPFPVLSQGYWLNRKQPVKPSLTTSVAVLSFGSQIWEARAPGSLCSSPCLEQCSGKLRMKEHQGRRKRQALTHLARSAGTGYKNNTTPLGEAHLPATLPHHQFAASNRAGWLADWLAGMGGNDHQADNRQETPPCMPQRESFQVGLDIRVCFL